MQTHWIEFFQIVCKSGTGRGCMTFQTVARMDDKHLDSIARGMNMLTLPSDGQRITAEAREWLNEQREERA